jgi:NDP-sugar pyrophosphorylase family protein
MINKDKFPNLVANHVVQENTTSNEHKQDAYHVVLENTTINKKELTKQVANHVALENTTINQENQLVHHVILENTMGSKNKLPYQVANHVAQENTTINKDRLPNLVANHVVLENTTISKDKALNLIAKTIAMLAPILNTIERRVLFAIEVNIKTKTTNQVANHAGLENTTIKRIKLLKQVVAKVAIQVNIKEEPVKYRVRYAVPVGIL